MAKKKKKSLIPRHKRLSRNGRLDAAKTWIAKYDGKSIVRGYRKHYAVDLNCAVIELEMLGVKIDPGYKKQLKAHQESLSKAKKQRKLEEEQKKLIENKSDSNDIFSFIAGYTSGGVPYGVTWEETNETTSGHVDKE